MLFEEQKKEEN